MHKSLTVIPKRVIFRRWQQHRLYTHVHRSRQRNVQVPSSPLVVLRCSACCWYCIGAQRRRRQDKWPLAAWRCTSYSSAKPTSLTVAYVGFSSISPVVEIMLHSWKPDVIIRFGDVQAKLGFADYWSSFRCRQAGLGRILNVPVSYSANCISIYWAFWYGSLVWQTYRRTELRWQ